MKLIWRSNKQLHKLFPALGEKGSILKSDGEEHIMDLGYNLEHIDVSQGVVEYVPKKLVFDLLATVEQHGTWMPLSPLAAVADRTRRLVTPIGH
jgi:hypothetical protein